MSASPRAREKRRKTSVRNGQSPSSLMRRLKRTRYRATPWKEDRGEITSGTTSGCERRKRGRRGDTSISSSWRARKRARASEPRPEVAPGEVRPPEEGGDTRPGGAGKGHNGAGANQKPNGPRERLAQWPSAVFAPPRNAPPHARALTHPPSLRAARHRAAASGACGSRRVGSSNGPSHVSQPRRLAISAPPPPEV